MNSEKLSGVLQSTEHLSALGLELLLKLALAIGIFYFGKWLAEALVRLLSLGMKRGGVDETLRDFLGNVLYGVLLTLVVVTALTQLGVETTSAAAVLGGAALAIGLSLQSQLSSLAAGVILIIFRPFKKGDYVEIGGTTGFVEEIKIVHTRMRSADNRELTVPNAAITTQTIINHTARPLRRVDLLVSVSYGSDLRQAKTLLLELALADERTLRQPAASVEVAALGAHSVDLNLFAWVRTENHGGLKAALLEAIPQRFAAAGIELARPQMDLRWQDARQPPRPAQSP